MCSDAPRCRGLNEPEKDGSNVDGQYNACPQTVGLAVWLASAEMRADDAAGAHCLNFHGLSTTLITPSSLSLNFLYISGASSRLAG